MFEWGPLILTFKLAAVTTLVLLMITLPLSYWLAYTKARWMAIVDTLVSMPLVLPPTVIGFYLLTAFSPVSFFGAWIDQWLGLQLVFSFEGLVLASVIYSLPFMVHPIQSGLKGLSESLKEAAYSMGKSKMETFIWVLLPNIKPAVVTGIILTFAHTIGEFGVVLMIGGNIPNVTRVASIAVYDEVESLNYVMAHRYSALLFAISFITLLIVYLYNRGFLKNILR